MTGKFYHYMEIIWNDKPMSKNINLITQTNHTPLWKMKRSWGHCEAASAPLKKVYEGDPLSRLFRFTKLFTASPNQFHVSQPAVTLPRQRPTKNIQNIFLIFFVLFDIIYIIFRKAKEQLNFCLDQISMNSLCQTYWIWVNFWTDTPVYLLNNFILYTEYNLLFDNTFC